MAHGAGWGSIENLRLRVLVLGAPERKSEAEGATKALSARHRAELIAHETPGLFGRFGAKLSVARAAQSIRPNLIHAFGASGAAAASGSVARGLGRPLILSLTTSDLDEGKGRSKRRTRGLVAAADAVVVDSEASADALRAAGIERDIYVVTPPAAPEDHWPFVGAIEVVYGRILAAHGMDLKEVDWIRIVEPDGSQIVRLGGKAR